MGLTNKKYMFTDPDYAIDTVLYLTLTNEDASAHTTIVLRASPSNPCLDEAVVERLDKLLLGISKEPLSAVRRPRIAATPRPRSAAV